MKVLEGIEPKEVMTYFEEICEIPHGSSNTGMISDYLVDFAKKNNLRYIRDEKNNVIIFKNGTKGYETIKPVIIQGHMDMVCEKKPDCDIDFDMDGLRLAVDEDVIYAEGTTLGGDDGIAVAFALALLADKGEISHPPLEVILTVDEEIGMLGATALDCSPLTGKTMLNLDSEDEGVFLVSCAGGATMRCTRKINSVRIKSDNVYIISVKGCAGGHSGMEIIKESANANKVLGRVLYSLYGKKPFSIIDIEGGKKDNAIPREASAFIAFDEAFDFDMESHIKEIEDTIKNEYKTTDCNISVTVERKNGYEGMAADESDSHIIIKMLYMLKNGISRMSSSIKNLVQTSLNLGIAKLEKREGEYEFICEFSVRSSVESEKNELINENRCIMECLGGVTDVAGTYPAWEYVPDSPLRKLMEEIFLDMYKKTPVIDAIHAGVECGIFAGKIPGLDCVSIGPDMENIHTTEEKLHIRSVQRTWEFVKKILAGIK